LDGHPQRLDLLTGARESLVPLSDGLLQRLDLFGQGLDVCGCQPDLYIEDVVLAADVSNVLLELLRSR
jgi:hypothetical protein